MPAGASQFDHGNYLEPPQNQMTQEQGTAQRRKPSQEARCVYSLRFAFSERLASKESPHTGLHKTMVLYWRHRSTAELPLSSLLFAKERHRGSAGFAPNCPPDALNVPADLPVAQQTPKMQADLKLSCHRVPITKRTIARPRG